LPKKKKIMVKTKLQFTLIAFISTMLVACYQNQEEEPESKIGNSAYILGNSNTEYRGLRTKDESLKAITIPCQDNNTFRLYYSDSAITLGLPDSLTVVAYSKRTSLAYRECCIEVTSSAGDTWLSTGSGKVRFAAGTGTIATDTTDQIWLQHFTSTPQPDSTTVYFNLIPE
jgi:hypothetical protein